MQLDEKDNGFLRVVAGTCIIMAHVVHLWVKRFALEADYLSLDFVAAVFDQLTRFTVPLFLFLSGYGLAARYRKRPMILGEYYRSRLLKIGAPFLLWSFLTSFRHINWFVAQDWSENTWGALGSSLYFFLVKGFDYQYYFLIAIFQFYLLFPFIYKMGRRTIWVGLFLLLHLSILAPMSTFLAPLGLSVPIFPSSTIIPYWLYAFVGIHVAWNPGFLQKWCGSWRIKEALLFWIAMFTLLNLDFFINLAAGRPLYHCDHFNRWPVVLYCMATLILYMKIRPLLHTSFFNRPLGEFVVTHLAPYNFMLYLGHTHLLRWAELHFSSGLASDLLFRILMVFGGTYLLAWSLQWLTEEFTGLRLWIGLPGRARFSWKLLRPAVPPRWKEWVPVQPRVRKTGEA